jgi:hypothetical protein
MAERPQLAGIGWLLSLRNASFRMGVLTGIYLSCVFVSWLVIANRVAELSITYAAAEIHFTLLTRRMGAFHVFMLGAVSYGFVAVLDWVFLMCAGVRHEHLVHIRETSSSAGRRIPH